MVHFYLSENYFKNDLISNIHQKSYTTEIKIDKNASRVSDQDQTEGVSCVSSSYVTCRNLDSPSLIQRPCITVTI